MDSTSQSPSEQRNGQPWYLATCGCDLVDEHNSPERLLDELKLWLPGTQEDIALWAVHGTVHQLIAVVKPLPQSVHVRWLN